MPADISPLLLRGLYIGSPFIVIVAALLAVAIKRRHAERQSLGSFAKYAAAWKIEGLLWLWFVLSTFWSFMTFSALILRRTCIECTHAPFNEDLILAAFASAIPAAIVYLIGVSVAWLLNRREQAH